MGEKRKNRYTKAQLFSANGCAFVWKDIERKMEKTAEKCCGKLYVKVRLFEFYAVSRRVDAELLVSQDNHGGIAVEKIGGVILHGDDGVSL